MSTEHDQHTTSLPVFRVDVAEDDCCSSPKWERCEIGQQLQFNVDTLQSYCFAAWETVIFDAFVVSAAVEFCDREFKRPSSSWGRQIHLRIPVHEPERWNANGVLTALSDTLNFLTGDEWFLEFRGRREPVDRPAQGRFSFPSNARAVIPFSEGLDSLSVAALESRKSNDELVHVRVGPKSMEAESAGPRRSFAAVPYRVVSNKKNFRENSARARGFKFTLVSGIAAYLAKIDTVILPESGQGALGSALAAVGQGYPDYRNHPAFTSRMVKLAHSLLQYRLSYSFPRLWYTKGETLRAYFELTKDDRRWLKSRSCWQSQRQTGINGDWRQCGVCAACMLRRMSVHAAGLSEPKAGYVWEDLQAAAFETGVAPGFTNITAAQREYAIAGVLHMDHLADAARSSAHARTVHRNAFLVGRCLGEAPGEVEVKIRRLLTRHEQEWASFLDSLGPESFIRHWSRR